MIDKRTLSLMADIMDGITGTDEWDEFQMNNSYIEAAVSRWKAVLEIAKQYLPKEVYIKSSDAQGSVAVAFSDAGILYGIRFAEVMREMVAHPEELTRYYLEKMEAEG